MSRRGWEVTLGIGEESTWGTGVVPTVFVDGLSISGPGENHPLIEVPVFRGRSVKHFIRGPRNWERTWEFPLQFEGAERFFYHAFGKVASSTTNTNVRQHIFSLDDTQAMPTGMSIQEQYSLTGTEALRYAGGKVDAITMNFEPGGVVTLSVDMVGKSVSEVAVASPSYSTSALVTWDKVTLKKGGSAIAQVKAASITFTNGYDRDDAIMGDAYKNQPTEQKRGLSGSITVNTTTTDPGTWRDVLDTDEEWALDVQMVGGSIAGSSPTDSYEILLACPDVRLGSFTRDVNSSNRMEETFDIMGRDDASELATLTMWNLTASVP